MSIGTIIFVITIIISIISTISDKSHKERQKQQPKQPRKEISTPNKGSFFEKVQQKMEEFEKRLEEFDEEPSEDEESKRTPSSQNERKTTPHPVEQTQKRPKPIFSTEEQQKTTNKQESTADLQRMLDQQMEEVDKLLNKERQKRIERLERRAKDILQDRYLSKRTKEIKLKQLVENSSKTEIQQHDLTFSDNEVVNGIIWSEVLQRPKQL